MKSPVRPELTTASVVRRQATPAALDADEESAI
jgi:hypothetical protein